MTTHEPPSGQEPEDSSENNSPGPVPPPPPPPPAYGEYSDASVPPPPPPSGPRYGFDNTSPYSATAAVGYGFNKFKENMGVWLLAVFLIFLVSIALSVITIPFSTSGDIYDPSANLFAAIFSPIEIIINIVMTAVGYILSAVLIRGALDETEGKKFDITSTFSRLDIVPIILLGILLSVGTTIGLILCVLPGIAFALLTMFSMLFLVDQKLSPIDAIKASYQLVTAKLGDSILTALVLIGVTLLGFLACCVGLLVAMPVTQIAIAYAYRRLQDQPVA